MRVVNGPGPIAVQGQCFDRSYRLDLLQSRASCDTYEGPNSNTINTTHRSKYNQQPASNLLSASVSSTWARQNYSQSSSSLSSTFRDSFGLLGAWLGTPDAAPTTS